MLLWELERCGSAEAAKESMAEQARSLGYGRWLSIPGQGGPAVSSKIALGRACKENEAWIREHLKAGSGMALVGSSEELSRFGKIRGARGKEACAMGLDAELSLAMLYWDERGLLGPGGEAGKARELFFETADEWERAGGRNILSNVPAPAVFEAMDKAAAAALCRDWSKAGALCEAEAGARAALAGWPGQWDGFARELFWAYSGLRAVSRRPKNLVWLDAPMDPAQAQACRARLGERTEAGEDARALFAEHFKRLARGSDSPLRRRMKNLRVLHMDYMQEAADALESALPGSSEAFLEQAAQFCSNPANAVAQPGEAIGQALALLDKLRLGNAGLRSGRSAKAGKAPGL